MVRKASRTID